MLYQQVALARAIGQQRFDFRNRLGIELAAFRRASGAVAGPSNRCRGLLSNAHKASPNTQAHHLDDIGYLRHKLIDMFYRNV